MTRSRFAARAAPMIQGAQVWHRILLLLWVCLLAACQPASNGGKLLSVSNVLGVSNVPNVSVAEPSIPATGAILPPLPAETAPPASQRENAPSNSDLPQILNRYFDTQSTNRLYLQTDKPLYRPGETIWFKAWDLNARSLKGANIGNIIIELVSPKGATVLKKKLQASSNGAGNDFELPSAAQGGEYTLRATAADGVRVERALIVSAYEAPRLQKKLEFIKKAYGAGDVVSAAIEVKRATGEVLGNKTLSAVIMLDGNELPRLSITTDTQGNALVKFNLPQTIAKGDGALTILVEDGGITESISKPIPIIMKKLTLAFFPEGGKMVAGLPSRLYFDAKTPLGKPADVDGRIIDDLGNAVATFSSFKNGLGRLEFTPATGRSYRAEISRPVGIDEKYDLPLAEEKGCVMRSFDDLDGQQSAIRVAVRCSEKQKVLVLASVRENLLDAGRVEADAQTPGVIYLEAAQAGQLGQAAGVARVTVFDAQQNPLAERLVFRNRRNRLQVKVQTDQSPAQASLSPRAEVGVTITTLDASGKPVPAELALAVVDDTVISFADDKSGHLMSTLLLEPELPGKVEEPNFYLDLSEAKSALALDLLMGTRGYRRFDWARLIEPPRPVPMMMQSPPKALAAPVPAPVPVLVPAPLALPRKLNAPMPLPPILAAPAAPAQGLIAPPDAGRRMRPQAEQAAAPIVDNDFARAADKMGKRLMAPQPEELPFALVRVFPVPTFESSYQGPRDDFRETVFWTPSVSTGQDGKASLKFVLSDAVTSFRIFAEGVGGSPAMQMLGRSETVFKSTLPFSLSMKLPLEVSAGDQPLIPITVSNDSKRSQTITLRTSFGLLMQPSGVLPTLNGPLAAGERKSLFYPLTVSAVPGQSLVRAGLSAGGLNDEVLRTIPVVPLGFPQLYEKSGQIKDQVTHEFDLSSATLGSVQGIVKIYPSPLSTIISGLEGMLHEPGGCFEQTSSANYPNIMIMQYLKQHDVADTVLLERTGKLLDSGYKLLTGFEAPNKGYEWFGADPGHEALTAYGLLEFADMRDVYGAVDPAMLARTGAWLKARRDGKGGYLRDPKALDSFGRASAEVTDAYITWALVVAGQTGLEKEIEKSRQLASRSQDAYQLALAVGTLLQKNPANGQEEIKAGLAGAARLAKMQAGAGAGPNVGGWVQAAQSITVSGGLNLHIETTALAILALLKADSISPSYAAEIRNGIVWLNNNRSGFGQWGATQATVLALKALNAYDAVNRAAPRPGTVTLLLDNVLVAEEHYEAGRREPLILRGFDAKLTPGKHRLTIQSSSGAALPYSLAFEYRSISPATASASVSLTTTLAKPALKMGETVRLEATITNKLPIGQPMTLVRLGLPGGLSFQNPQLKALREKGEIAFFETRAREVVLYFRDMKPSEVKKIGIDLVATVPGSYTGPASAAYLYYTDTEKSWAAPLAVKIVP